MFETAMNRDERRRWSFAGLLRAVLFLVGVMSVALGLGRTAAANDANGLTVTAEDVQATIVLSDNRSFGGQRLGTAVDFNVGPGWHIYGEPLPTDYTPTSVKFDDTLVASQSLTFPKPKPVKFDLLDEVLPVYEGNFKARGYILFKQKLPTGQQKLAGTVNFQECNDNICKLPQSIHFEIPITLDASVPALPKK